MFINLTKNELREDVSAEDRQVPDLAELPDGYGFEQAFSVLFAWCQSAFICINRIDCTDVNWM